MPIIKSAKKRVRVASKAATRNSKTKRTLRSAIKSFHAAITGDNANSAQSALDIAVKKGVIHKKKPVAKPAVKKAVAKKAPAKKPAAKK